MKKDTFLFKRTGKANSITLFVLSADYNKQGKFACIQHLSAVDVDTVPTRIDLGFVRGADFISLMSFVPTLANQTVAYINEIWSYIDDMPAMRIVGAVIGDEIELVVGGYILYNDTEE